MKTLRHWPPMRPLNERDRRILAMAADGVTQMEIGLRLGLSQHRVWELIHSARARIACPGGPSPRRQRPPDPARGRV